MIPGNNNKKKGLRESHKVANNYFYEVVILETTHYETLRIDDTSMDKITSVINSTEVFIFL